MKYMMLSGVASGVVIHVAGKDFPLSVSELVSLLEIRPREDPEGKKLQLLRLFADHPVASVRRAVIESGVLPDAILERLSNDKACNVRLAAKKALKGVRTPFLDLDDDGVDKVPCAEVSYAGAAAPMFPGELEAYVWHLYRGAKLLREGQF